MSLSQKQATLRSSIIDYTTPLNYRAVFALIPGEQYHVSGKIDYRVKESAQGLFLDWQSEKFALKLQENKEEVAYTEEVKQTQKIPLKGSLIGSNSVEFQLTNVYGNDGYGLHSFTDTDTKQYIYSHLEPHAMRKIFPNFDQPDLKGTFTVQVLAPKIWEVVSNERITNKRELVKAVQEETENQILQALVQSLGDKVQDYDLWDFHTTQVFSTYLFALAAGPFRVIELEKEKIYNNVPMRFYVRDSLYDHLNKVKDALFEITIQTMRYYDELFGYRYPFSKYDQVFCPEYNMGAMENVGCVTINDNYIFKEKVSVERLSYRAIVIAHEMAHMWFGDLVTMKWWNDLWLNESFAEFISHLALIESKFEHSNFADFWILFLETKVWGYETDQNETTHPITGDVENTEVALNIFDGITYAKGAAVLKQIYFSIGKENFAKAMNHYFHTFEFRNTELSDFIGSFAQILGPDNQTFDIKSFEKDWLGTASLNEILPVLSKEQKKLTIIQTLNRPEHTTLRNHVIKVCLFGKDGTELRILKDIVVEQKTNTDIDLSGLLSNEEIQQIQAVLLNYNDEGYVKVLLDEKSVQYFNLNLARIDSALSRCLIWISLYDMVQDAKVSFRSFVLAASRNLPQEKNDTVLKIVIQSLYEGVIEYTPRNQREEANGLVYDLIVKLIESQDWTDNRIILLRQFISAFSHQEKHVHELLEWYKKSSANCRYWDQELGLENQWKIVIKAHQSKYIKQDVRDLLLKELQAEDQSDQSKQHTNRCIGLNGVESEETRNELWKNFLDKTWSEKQSVQLSEQTMIGWNANQNYDDVVKFQERFFEALPVVFADFNLEYAKAFYNSLFPINDDLELVKKLCDELIPQVSSDTLKKSLQTSADTLNKRIKAYKIY